MNIKDKVISLTNKFDTNCPFKLAKALGIYIQYENLGSILGYYSKHYRIKIIHINNAIDENKQLFTCAHELGHAVCHPDANTSFLKKHTLFSADRIELEANAFALELLSLKGELYGLTINEAVEQYGIPKTITQGLGKNFLP